MNASVPPVDPRGYAELVRDTEQLAQLFSPWRPPSTGADLGRALIALFAGMAEQVLRRLNAFPDRDFLAFLELLGVEPLPPRPARVPLTFSPPAGSTVPGFVPAGTPVATSAQAGPAVRFYTDRDLVVGPAALASAVVLEPAADRQAQVIGPASGTPDLSWPAFAGDSLVEHALYVARDDLLALPRPRTLSIRVTPADPGAPDAFAALPLEWSAWDGERWQELPPVSHPGQGAVTALGDVPEPGATTVAGRTARWIRARLNRAIGAVPGLPDLRIDRVAVIAEVAATTAPLTAAFVGAVRADLSGDVYPFGEQPRFTDNFTLGSEVLGRPGAEVTLDVARSRGVAVQPASSADLVLVWEVGGANGWVPVGRSGKGTTPQPGFNDGTDGLTSDGQVRFVVPPTGGATVLNGVSGWWLRVRIAAGDYGRPATYVTPVPGGSPVFVPASFAPPAVAGIRLGWAFQGEEPASALVARNGDEEDDRTGGVGPFPPFAPLDDDRPGLHLGFDRPFPNRPVLLHVQVEPAPLDPAGGAAAPAHLDWEYAAQDGWRDLGAVDETGGLTRSGPVAFLGPADLVPTTRFGRSLCWLRVRPGAAGPVASPRLRRILTNTVPASAAYPEAVEVLGSGTGNAGVRLRTTRTPVLAGELVEVQIDGLWQPWQRVPDFNASGPLDRHYALDRALGEVSFGDGRRGAVPPAGGGVRATYRSGGGSAGNQPAGAVTELQVALAGVASVTNLEPAAGGAEGEPLERLRVRGPVALRHGGRAVAAEDYTDLAVTASSDVARAISVPVPVNPLDVAWIPPVPIDPGPSTADGASVLCVAPSADAESHRPSSAGRVAVVVVPETDEARPMPTRPLLDEVGDELRPRCPAVLGADDVPVLGPEWIQVSVTTTVAPTDLAAAQTLAAAVGSALERFLHPLHGGPDGTGWVFGRAPHRSDLMATVAAVAGVDHVVRLDLQETPPRGGLAPDVLPRTLVWSGTHTVTVAAPGGAP